ncbi:ALF repeat-containing protein [Streptomyces sp. NPDC037389]|uniref:ALF repeat-containing protein n=1 Tax=Streptomyces sp. NPDC037389 TaxID=3155369 RepID=UPI0033CAF6ED
MLPQPSSPLHWLRPFSSPAIAADVTTPAGASAPDKAAEVKPEEGTHKKQIGDDKFAILKILGEENIGCGLKTRAEKALNDTPADMHGFLTTGQYAGRDEDNRFAILRMLGMDKNVGPGVREAAKTALKGTPEDVRRFLEVGQYEAHAKDEAAEKEAKDKEKTAPGPAVTRTASRPPAIGRSRRTAAAAMPSRRPTSP